MTDSKNSFDDATRSWEADRSFDKPGGLLTLPARWRLEHPVGRGGQGQVWLAHDLETDQPVAIKVFDHDLLPAARERLRREVRVGREVHHPNLVALYELVESGSNLALVMELLPGGSLRDAIKKEELSVETVITVTGQILDGLACLHEAGVVHRDIKPSNILLDEQVRRDLLSLWAFFRGNWNDPSLDPADASPIFPQAERSPRAPRTSTILRP